MDLSAGNIFVALPAIQCTTNAPARPAFAACSRGRELSPSSGVVIPNSWASIAAKKVVYITIGLSE